MFRTWAARIATFTVALGALALATAAWWPAADEPVESASLANGAESTDDRTADPEEWRNGIMLAGGVCLVAGLLLLALALVPGRTRFE